MGWREDVKLGIVRATKIFLGDGNAKMGTDIEEEFTTKQLGVDRVLFDTSYVPASHVVGGMHWDADNHTVSIGMIGGEVELQIGQEHFIYAFNQTGSTIPNGAAVYIADAGDSKPRIALADADNVDPIPEAVVIGLATENIAHGSSGFITTQGLVRDLDTTGITEGVPLWLSDTPGEWTETRPVAPIGNIGIGYCLYAHNNAGVILVSPVLIPRLIGLSDVLFETPSDGDVLMWSAANSRFELTQLP